MAKRYTDTDKWKKPFIKSLPIEYKAFFLYLLDECDHAGIWHVELEIAQARLGTNLSKDKALKHFNGRVFEFDNHTKWFVLDFIIFQYGVLNPQNKVHASVIERISKYNLLEKFKELTSPLQSAKDKEKEKDIIGGVGDFQPDNSFAMKPKQAPEFQQVHEFFVRQGRTEAEARRFYNHYDGLGWMKGITPITNWAAFASTWIANPIKSNTKTDNSMSFQDEFNRLKEQKKHG